MYRGWAAIVSYVPLQVLSTGLGEVRSCTLQWMNSSGKRLMLFAQSIFSTLRSSQHSISSVTVYVRLYMMYVCISKCIHLVYMNLEHLSSMCAYDDKARLDSCWQSRLVLVISNSMRVYEWWWESRLDFMRIWYISTRKNAEVSTRFCQDFLIFLPVMLTNCPSYGTLAKPTTSRHILYWFHTDYQTQ